MTTNRKPCTPQADRAMIAKLRCHFAPAAPLSTQRRPTRMLPIMTVRTACQTFRPRAIRAEPVVHPPILKEPVTTRRVTNSHGPNVLLPGSRGQQTTHRDEQNGIGAHTDVEFFTIIACDTEGLEVLGKSRNWIKVKPIPGAFVVNFALLNPVETCVSEENPARYELMTAGEYYEWRTRRQKISWVNGEQEGGDT
ncbi:hypothetical protein BJX62DRAFT_207638 [Aspergillus germanicus]